MSQHIDPATDPAKGFRVSVVCDSISSGVRLTTFACRFPRVILAEVNTHRALGRNAASSRAIPTAAILEQVRHYPYLPGDLPDGPLCGNRPGMVATDPLDDDSKGAGFGRLMNTVTEAVNTATYLSETAGYHKQDANRYLEPFQWVRWVGTATDWTNFFALRTDHRAYPPFRFLARCMWVAYRRSEPADDRLHLPFVVGDDWCATDAGHDMVEPPEWFPGWWYGREVSPKVAFNLMAWSAARCARVSVRNFRTDATDRVKDMETFRKLVSDTPRHASPLEHQAFASGTAGAMLGGNFRKPWCQFRKLLPAETAETFDPPADAVSGWNVPDDVFGGVPGVDW